MTKEKILYQGAEAIICKTKYMDFDVVEKRRIKKSYRIKNIDDRLISFRTKEEAKLMMESRKYGVSVPIIYDVDLKKGIITMGYIDGDRIKDILNDLTEGKRHRICKKIGVSIAKFHNNDIIHGDITTSNSTVIEAVCEVTWESPSLGTNRSVEVETYLTNWEQNL